MFASSARPGLYPDFVLRVRGEGLAKGDSGLYSDCVCIQFAARNGETMDWTALKGGRRIGDLLAVGAIAALLAAGFRSVPVTAVVAPYPHDLAQVSFAVAGDVIPHEAVREAAAAEGDG